VRRKGQAAVAAMLAVSAGLIVTPVALAGTCTNPCVGIAIVDNESNIQPSSVNSVSGTKVLHGMRSWSFGMTNGNSVATTNASLSVESGYPASDFAGVSSFPVTASSATLGPNKTLGFDLNSTIGVAFSSGFNSSRAMTPTVIPAKGGNQSVKVTFKRTNASACPTNMPGLEGCGFQGHLGPGLAGAAITAVIAPKNLNQKEGFSSSFTASGANWNLNDPILGKQYALTVVISLPKEANSYHYKPEFDLSLSAAGGHGCGGTGGDTCVGPTTTVTLADATLDGPTPGAGKITFSIAQAYLWDEGGPPLQTSVTYSALFP
jgi:hypothetical protein